MHPRMLLAIAALGLACACAQAAPAIYHCQDEAGPSFQDTGCAGLGGRVFPEVRRATPDEVRAARAAAGRERRFVERVETDRARRRDEAAAERTRQDTERERLARRCASYEELIAAAHAGEASRSRREAWRNEQQLRDARARHFSECLGRR